MTSRKVLAGIALGILLLTINAGNAFVGVRELDENNRRAAHTHRVLTKLQATHSLLQAAEAGHHRFLLVDDPHHLAPVRIAIASLGGKLDELREVTSGNARHQVRLCRLRELADSKLREFEAAVDSREASLASVRERAPTHAGRQAMDQIRLLIDEMRAEEEALLEYHHARSQAGLIGTRTTLLLSSLADFTLVGLAGWLIRRDTRARQASELSLRNHAQALERANRELSRLCGEAEAATRAKSEFLANMSHEIRTPMTAILGHAELLLASGQSSPQVSISAQAIERNGEHLLQLINDVLDLSKIEAGKFSIERTRCSPREVLDEVRGMMESRIASRGLSFELRIDGSIPQLIESDPTRLRQILLNLVGNSIKFTERGGIRLVCRRAGASPEGSPRLCIDVIDTGIGISPERLAQLFQPFAQADSSTTRRFGGTGLGLFISRRLAEALGGALVGVSRPGAGSRFTLVLPLGSPDSAPPLDDQPSATEVPRSGVGVDPARSWPVLFAQRRVLLAEDGPDNQYLISLHLRGAGMEVDVAGNGRLAVERALEADRAHRPYDLILMDMQMSELDGYSATACLRRMRYDGRIIALTAHAMEGDREKCLAAGCNDYLSKPVTRERLLRTVASNLSAGSPASRAPRDTVVFREGMALVDDHRAPLVSMLADDARMTAPIKRFVGRLPDRIDALLAAVARDDRETLVREAHRLKGTAGSYGFPWLTEAAAVLERELRTRGEHDKIDLASLHELVDLCRRASAPYAKTLPEREDASQGTGD